MRDEGYPTGFHGVIRRNRRHALNMRAALQEAAAGLGKDAAQINAIVAHLDEEITLAVFEKGEMADIVMDTEGPFAPKRSGRVPLNPLVYHCIENHIPIERLPELICGKSGLAGMLGSDSAAEAERRARAGDKMAALLYEAMAYQTAKAIGELATVTCGEIDRIILTGPIAGSASFTKWISDRVKFIAPVDVLTSADGQEEAHVYAQEEDGLEEIFSLSNIAAGFTPSI